LPHPVVVFGSHDCVEKVKIKIGLQYVLLPGRRAKYCDEYMYVFLSARISQKPHGRTSSNFCRPYMFSVAVAPSCSDRITIRYVLPVSWITSCFHTGCMWLINHHVYAVVPHRH